MLNATEERKFKQLRSLGKALGVPVPEAFLDIEVRRIPKDGGKDGRLLCPYCNTPIPTNRKTCPKCGAIAKIHQRSHSWTRNAYNHLLSQLAAKDGNGGAAFGAGFLNIKTTAAAVKTGTKAITLTYSSSMDTPSASVSGYTAAAGDVTTGIVAGSNVGAESFEDFVLLSPIANGTGAGNLSYVASEVPTISWNGGTLTFTVTHIRYMNNNTGGDVTVREVAIYCGGYTNGGVGPWCNSRDHIADVVIPNTGQLKVTYTIALVYPV